MDKNFIRIDDLVRQRLVGGEEQERGGAWLNMRDLLDKEMPQQRRIGVFYWRRIFSAVAVLSLVGTVCVGSYELASAYRGGKTGSVMLANASKDAVNNEPDRVYELPANEAENKGAGNVAHRVAEHANANTNKQERQMAGTETSQPENYQSTSEAIVGKPVTDDRNNGTTPRKNNSNKQSDNSTKTSNDNNTRNSFTGSNNIAKKQTATSGTGDHQVASNTTSSNKKHTANTNTTAATGKVTASTLSGSKKNASAADMAHTAPVDVNRTKTDGNVAENGNNESAHNSIANVKDSKQTPGTAVAPVSISAPTGSIAATDGSIGKTTLPGEHANATSVLNSSAPAGLAKSADKTTVTPAIVNNEKGSKAEESNTKNNETVAAPAKTNPAVPAVANVATPANNKPAAATSAKNYGTGGTMARNNGENHIKGKRVITRMLVHQSTIKVSENEFVNKLDTISIEQVNMELGIKPVTENKLAGNNRKYAQGKAGALNDDEATDNTASVAKNTASAAARKSGNNNVDEDGQEESKIMPAATASSSVAANHTGGAETKSKASKKGSGVSLLARMSAAFNDVKTNASGAQFSAGITAGINSNFFGPHSFKGFQFGMTANMVFNDSWNLLGELKYFHRLNNNSAIEDNYYVYTQVGNQYRKDLLMNSYSFSALHSLEMPVAIRYSKGNFNFYTGGNFLYSFSINTGAATMPSNIPGTFVNEQGTDNAPKYKEEDFRSRFGLGYLLGFSYLVGPNTSIDLRSVQTLWDNAATTGAKSISGELYKTPSLQLSIMYRLGGNRSKD
jgi:hypothetical protein